MAFVFSAVCFNNSLFTFSDADALGIRSQMQQYKDSHSNGNNSQNQEEKTENKRQYGKFDSSALHIQHALRATEVQRKYSKKSEEPIEAYLDREEQIRFVWQFIQRQKLF